ncbi:hypothetical protein A4R35_22645 [Thermogemmatispora tikiterensis]|uniref:Uncharacterized protein n=1 Tax=Thermogemmatispora tikiterensis TaxID=1825093 RepID=A0A328VLK0_9CHLR|nr:hypothetical protein A4R35_22645 [Thermogemmatispora tikiterensis]
MAAHDSSQSAFAACSILSGAGLGVMAERLVSAQHFVAERGVVDCLHCFQYSQDEEAPVTSECRVLLPCFWREVDQQKLHPGNTIG